MLPMDLTMAAGRCADGLQRQTRRHDPGGAAHGVAGAIERVRGGRPPRRRTPRPMPRTSPTSSRASTGPASRAVRTTARKIGEGDCVGMPTGTVVDCICYILVGQSRQGLLVTLEVQEKDGEFTPINVTAIRSPRYSIDGATISRRQGNARRAPDQAGQTGRRHRAITRQTQGGQAVTAAPQTTQRRPGRKPSPGGARVRHVISSIQPGFAHAAATRCRAWAARVAASARNRSGSRARRSSPSSSTRRSTPPTSSSSRLTTR